MSLSGVAVDPFHGQDFARRAVPIDGGGAEFGVADQVFREFGRRRRFEAKVHLHAHASRQRVDDLHRAQATQARFEALGRAGGEEHVGEIAGEAPLDAGPQQLDRNVALALARSHPGAMHLRDRSGGDRVAEFDEHGLDFCPEGRLDARRRDGALRRRHAVLQLFELHRHLGADDVGARGEKLPELDVGGAEPVDGGGQAADAARAAPRHEIGERQRRPGERRQSIRIDADEGALARQHETGARQARSVSDGGQTRQVQSFQPEWIATTPPVSRVNSTRRNPASATMSAKRSGGGNLRINSTR